MTLRERERESVDERFNFRLFPLKSTNMNDRKYFLYYKVLLSDMPPASSLQPASLVVPPCQDIAYHIPNQEDNKVVKKERERDCAIIITLLLTPHQIILTVSKKSDILYATHSIERARGLHSTSSSSFYLLPPPASSHLQSGESVNP